MPFSVALIWYLYGDDNKLNLKPKTQFIELSNASNAYLLRVLFIEHQDDTLTWEQRYAKLLWEYHQQRFVYVFVGVLGYWVIVCLTYHCSFQSKNLR